MDKMITYFALFFNEESRNPILDDMNNISGIEQIILIDLTYGTNEAIDFKKQLEQGRRSVIIKSMDDGNYNDIANQLLKICVDEDLKQRRSSDIMDGYFEVSNLNGLYSGAVFSVANLLGGNVVYKNSREKTEVTKFKKLPDVRRASLSTSRLLDILYENGPTSYENLGKQIYANEIAGMDDEEKKQFMDRHHNMYKVLNAAESKEWIKFDKTKRLYNITNEGLAARALIDKRDFERSSKDD